MDARNREKDFLARAGALAWALPTDSWLYEDDCLVVVSKPAGMSVSGSEHDLLSRVRIILDFQAKSTEGLGAPIHLDRDVSGVVALAASKQANASMSRQVQQHALSWTFVVAVSCSFDLAPRGQRDVGVIRDRNGLMRASRGKSDKRVHLDYQVQSRQGDRYLIEVRCADGPRAIRAVLASMGIAVAGDVVFKGPEASRLLLHAKQLTLLHPRHEGVVTYQAPEPWAFHAWMHRQQRAEQLDTSSLAQALKEAACKRFSLCARGLEAFRHVHGEAEGLRGLDIEWYGNHAVMWVDEQTRDRAVDGLLAVLGEWEPAGIYLKKRPKQASRASDGQGAPLVFSHAVRGQNTPEPFSILEDGLEYLVDLGQGLSTGLFLDMRRNRAWVRQNSHGAEVLNLFSYTCSFTVAAAAGGAKRTVSVDISKRSLEVGDRNLLKNGLKSPNHEFVCDDVRRWVERANRHPHRFDMIIFDPPSFGTSRWGRFSVMRDYESLVSLTMRLLRDGGWLLACTNHRAVRMGKLQGWLQSAASAAGCRWTVLERASADLDFPVGLEGEPHLKAFRCRVAWK